MTTDLPDPRELMTILDRDAAPALDGLLAIHRDAVPELGEEDAAMELFRTLATTDRAQVVALLVVAVQRLVGTETR